MHRRQLLWSGEVSPTNMYQLPKIEHNENALLSAIFRVEYY